MPSLDIIGLMSSAKNALGTVINSLSAMPAIPLSISASLLPGQRLANEMTPEVPVSRRRKSWRRDIQVVAQLQLAAEHLAVSVSFNPQFFLNGKETAAPAGLTGALNMSLHELEKMLERLLAQKQRRGTNNVCGTG